MEHQSVICRNCPFVGTDCTMTLADSCTRS